MNIFDRLNGGLLVTDTKGKILFTNEYIRRHKGVSEKEFLGQAQEDFWGRDVGAKFYEEMWHTIADDKAIFSGEMIHKKSAEHESINVIPLVDEKNRIRYYLELTPNLYGEEENHHFADDIKRLSISSKTPSKDFWYFLASWNQCVTCDNLECKFQQILGLVDSLFYPEDEALMLEDKHIVGFAQMDAKQFGFFYDKYFDRIYYYFLKRVSNQSKAEELAQEVFLLAFKHLSNFKFKSCSYLSYLMTIAHNLLVNYYRQDKSSAPLEAAYNKGTDPMFVDELVQKSIWEYVAQLSESEAKIIRMYYSEGLNSKEISQKIRKSANAVKVKLSRARRHLKSNLTAINAF